MAGAYRAPVLGTRTLDARGGDPFLARREQQRRQLLDISPDANVTFREATESFIEVK